MVLINQQTSGGSHPVGIPTIKTFFKHTSPVVELWNPHGFFLTKLVLFGATFPLFLDVW